MRKNIFIISIIISLMIQQSVMAGIWHKDSKTKIGNEIKIEEYPDSKDVEPKLEEVEA